MGVKSTKRGIPVLLFASIGKYVPMTPRSAAMLFLMVLLLASCLKQSPQLTSSPELDIVSTHTQGPRPTRPPTRALPTSTWTAAPSATARAAPTATSMLALPITPVAIPTLGPQAISPGNAADVTLLARLGKGTAEDVAWSPDGKLLAVSGSAGIYVYDTGSWKERLSIEAGPVFSIAIHPDGRTLAAGLADGTVHIWDISTGQELSVIEAHTEYVTSVAYSPDGLHLASGSGDVGSGDVRVRVWSVGTGQLLHDFDVWANTIGNVAFSPDGSMLASGSDVDGVKLWDVKTGALLQTMDQENETLFVAFAPDGLSLVSTGGYEAHFWEVATGKLLQTIDPYEILLASESQSQCDVVVGLAINPDGGTLVLSCQLGDTYAFDAQTRKFLYRLEGTSMQLYHQHIVAGQQYAYLGPGLAFSPSGRSLASAGGLTVLLSDSRTGQTLRTLRGFTPWLPSFAFHPDGSILATAGKNYGVHARLWDTTGSYRLMHTYSASDEIVSIVFSRDGHLFAAGSEGSIAVWDTRTGKMTHTLDHLIEDYYPSIDVSPDGLKLVSSSDGGTVYVWDIGTGETLLSLEGHGGRVDGVAFSKDGRMLASGAEDKTVCVWDASTGQLLRRLEGHAESVSEVTFSPDGYLLASGDAAGKVRVWDLSTGQVRYEINAGGSSVDFNRDGTLLVTAGDHIRILDASSGKILATLDKKANLVAFSPYGSLLASGRAGVVNLWGLPER